MNKYKALCLSASIASLLSISPSNASPWANPGDSSLRSDVELLAHYGLISGPVNSWPMSWKQITRGFYKADEMSLPTYVNTALIRVREKIPNKINSRAQISYTNNSTLIRGFDKSARNDFESDATVEYNTDNGTTIHIEGGYRSGDGESYTHLDSSYISQDIGNWAAYAGTVERWWGPGRENTLLLGTNARPMPSIGLRRIEAKPFETKWLNWVGPWQWDMFLARMEDDRYIPNALIAGMRLTFEPINNFEVGLSRILQLCGEGRPCNFETWGRAIIAGGGLDNNRGEATEPGNQLASVDLSYTLSLMSAINFKLYGNVAGEDETFGFPYKFSTLVGTTLYGPIGNSGSSWRFTTEFFNTSAHRAVYFGVQEFNIMYNHNIYRTGYRYKERTLGHSLDTDSKQITIAAEYMDERNWSMAIKYHKADINFDDNGFNLITLEKKSINIFETTVNTDLPFGSMRIKIRHSDDSIIGLKNNNSNFAVAINFDVNY